MLWLCTCIFSSCTVGTWKFWFISTNHLHLENLSYSKKQQEQAEERTKQYHQSINSGSLFQLSSMAMERMGASEIAVYTGFPAVE